MSYSNTWRSGTAIFMALGIASGSIVPILAPAPATAQANFPDVPASYWANGFIRELASRGIIAGFAEDGTFRPEEPVTRAQFAAMVSKAFSRSPIRNPIQFVDVPANYWGRAAIDRAYTTGFLTGYPGNVFRPQENIPRAQVLVSLANGLNYAAAGSVETVLAFYSDATSIPGFARPSVAAATERQLVVNYPDVKLLNPTRQATRAEVAAFIYQALVSAGQAQAISSPFIVGGQTTPPVSQAIPAGTSIPVRYERAERILLAQNEPQPAPVTLTVAQNIVSSRGDVLIPAGTQITGQLQTVRGGAQFTSSQLVLADGRQVAINAASEVITKTETIRRGASTGKIITSTVVGAGAAAAIAGVTGDRSIKAEEVLGGAALGALATVVLGGDRADLIVVNPNTDLTLTLNSDLVLR